MPSSNRRSPPTAINFDHLARRNPFSDENPAPKYHGIALRAAKTGHKPQQDVIHAWLQDVRERLEVSNRINRTSPVAEVDHESSWKTLFASSPKTQSFLKPLDPLPPPRILSRDVLLHSSPPEPIQTSTPARMKMARPQDRKREHSSIATDSVHVKAANTAFEKRPRHKTRHDRYDSKRRRHRTDRRNKSPERKKQRKESMQEPRTRSGQDIMRNFTSSYLGQGRIALKPKLGSGLFANGKGSDAHPMPNLKFAETVFPTGRPDFIVQSGSNDRPKYRRKQFKERHDATEFFDQSMHEPQGYLESFTNHPATPVGESSLRPVQSSTRGKSVTGETIVKSIENIQPSQRIIAVTPYRNARPGTQLSSLSKNRCSIVDASSRRSSLRMNSKHVSPAVPMALTQCKVSRSNYLDEVAYYETISSATDADQVALAPHQLQKHTQTEGNEVTRRDQQDKSVSKPSSPRFSHIFNCQDERQCSAHLPLKPYMQLGEGPTKNRQFDTDTPVIPENSPAQKCSELQEGENLSKYERVSFFPGSRPPHQQQIWDVDSIDAAIEHNPGYFVPVHATYNKSIQTLLDNRRQESHWKTELGIHNVQQSPAFHFKNNRQDLMAANIRTQQGDRYRTKEADSVVEEQTASKDSVTGANPRISAAAMRAFWTPNYFM